MDVLQRAILNILIVCRLSAVNNVNPKDVFDYSIHPMSLTTVKRPLKEEDTDEEYSSPMKIASVMQQKQKLEQQSYEDFAHDRRLHAKTRNTDVRRSRFVLF